MVTKYGIISDIHQYPQNIESALKLFQDEGVDRILLNGDGGEEQVFAYVLDKIGRSGIECWVQPGSHETVSSFFRMLGHFAEKYPAFYDATKIRKLKEKDHQIVFLPGSDTLAGGEFKLGTRKEPPRGAIEVADYATLNKVLQEERLSPGRRDRLLLGQPEKMIPREVKRTPNLKEIIPAYPQYNHLIAEVTPEGKEFVVYETPLRSGLAQGGGFFFSDMEDLEALVDHPCQTILVVHIPPRFSFGGAADTAFYGEKGVKRANGSEETESRPAEKAIVPGYGQLLTNSLLDPEEQVPLRKENRGNEALMKKIQGIWPAGSAKVIFGHFHESVTKAHDRDGKAVSQESFTEELFWNASCLDYDWVGILEVDGTKVKHKNFYLPEFL